jgi:hypothetical protein
MLLQQLLQAGLHLLLLQQQLHECLHLLLLIHASREVQLLS